MMEGMFVAVLLCFGVSTVSGYGTGAPTEACESLRPNHTGVLPQTSNSPYSLEIVGGVTNFTQGTPVKGLLYYYLFISYLVIVSSWGWR